MRNLSYKVVEKIKTHLTFKNFSSENRSVYEIMWKNMVELDRPHTMAHAHFMLDTYGY
jgi:hypothetical protein